MDSYHFFCRHFRGADGNESKRYAEIYIICDIRFPVLSKSFGYSILSQSCWKCDLFNKCLYLKLAGTAPTVGDTPDMFRRLSGFIENGEVKRKNFLGLSCEEQV